MKLIKQLIKQIKLALWKRNYQSGIPLFSHWACSNCDCWLMNGTYKNVKEDLGFPNCGVSLSSFVYKTVDAQKKYDEIMGFDK